MTKWIVLLLPLCLFAGCRSSVLPEPPLDTPIEIETPLQEPPQIETPKPPEPPRQESPVGSESPSSPEAPFPSFDRDTLLAPLRGRSVIRFGESIPGVMTRFRSEEPRIALTFDACGGLYGSGYDEALVEFLIQEEIPATLFFNGRWIENNPEIFLFLARHPLFEVANHGDQHRPLSVNGASIYGIQGTTSLDEAYDEVMKNQERIHALTGALPRFFRSGTAYYDDVAVDLIHSLGLIPVNFDVLGDAGGTFNKTQIAESMNTAKEGSILLFHMNLPDRPILEGLKEGIEVLRQRGFHFVTLGDVFDDLY